MVCSYTHVLYDSLNSNGWVDNHGSGHELQLDGLVKVLICTVFMRVCLYCLRIS